jgi:sulfite reductase (NADPH) flavoprotein alpha-component
MSDAAPRLDGVAFGVLALGRYRLCGILRRRQGARHALEALGGKRIADRVDCDLDFAEPAAKWIDGTLKVLAPEARPDDR